MNTHANMTQETKNQSVSATNSQNLNGGVPTFQLVDNRSEAVSQRKLQEIYRSSPLLSNGINNSSPVTQNQVIQKKIDWNSTSLRFSLAEPEKNVDGFVRTLENMFNNYGEGFKPIIREVVQYANDHGSWTIARVFEQVNFRAKQFGLPYNDAGFGLTGVTLPTKPSSQRDFGFPSHTRAVATIGGQAYERESNPEKGHAEEQLKPLLEKLASEGRIDVNEDTLILTINNFPCLERCVPLMLELKTKYPFMRINYANPYGGEEFDTAFKKLREVGIALVPFDPRLQMSPETKAGLTDDQSTRFKTMASSRAKHPTPIQLIYEYEGEDIQGAKLPPEVKDEFEFDVLNGKLKEGDRFEVKRSDGQSIVFTYWGFNREGKLIVRVFKSQ
ncbi:hypothetical protein [Tenacibaculum agarivorans]|uniref:hypothetical protein n=1 Tax=Tenacibaculum agarivorans TaxID=1908389 RepID=UPI00094B7AEF|nr:hypothetical protein [Tenacibaculum agarivorans]